MPENMYTPELAELICSRVASGESMLHISKDEGMPTIRTMFRWMRVRPEFEALYLLAKEECADFWAEQIIPIADDATEDVQRSRLKVDTRKWIACKLKPKRYGDRIELGGSVHLSYDQAIATLLNGGTTETGNTGEAESPPV